MNKLNVAVIGVGSMGKNHARVYSEMENVNLVAIADTDKAIGKNIADKYGTNHYTDYKDMLKKEEIDAVSVSVPTKLHKDVAIDAIRKKINVLVEKPIAADIGEAKSMINDAEKSNVKLMVGHIERFNPVVAELKKRIKRNELGKIYKVHCVRMGPSVHRIYDVGVIIDLAIHEIDVLRYIIDSKIKRVYAETARKIHSTHEDLLIGTIRFDNGILGVINANWLTPKKVREIAVTGEKGMFVANYLTQELYFHENDFIRKNVNYKSYSMTILEGRTIKLKMENKEPLRNELEAFAGCILKNKEPLVTGNDGLEALRIAQKFIESSKANKTIII
ncbi:Gfo/Idh/MocA family oxidoreductase [Candidatus Woesearchaeota archaeon]|nr:Gfo/Idh/MocA family oxidoreductase [Candidatus Woesearchaeota archaeon]